MSILIVLNCEQLNTQSPPLFGPNTDLNSFSVSTVARFVLSST